MDRILKSTVQHPISKEDGACNLGNAGTTHVWWLKYVLQHGAVVHERLPPVNQSLLVC